MLPPTPENLLWEAARDGKDGEIERLIDAGTHVDCVNPDRVRSPHLTSPHLLPPPPPPPPLPLLLLPSPPPLTHHPLPSLIVFTSERHHAADDRRSLRQPLQR